MSQNIDTHYEFFPSVRAGYRPRRKYGESLDGRSTFGVELTVEGKEKGGDWKAAADQPEVDMRLYGPGDVAGIDERQVVRVEPEPDTSTMAPNYFPLVEFDRADLPWLFSPARANPAKDAKAQPWFTLVVVETAMDAVSVEADGTKPLPALTAPQDELPPVEEAWAWAHVQVTGKLSDAELERVFTGTSDQAVARLLCPRNLDPNTRYLAAVVPTFEPGRRTGLGKAPFGGDGGGGDGGVTVGPAWDASKSKPVTLPVYYQWEFATGNEGDFESLVRELEPRQLSAAGVGKREIDLSDPGPPSLEDTDTTFEIGGALMSPGMEQSPLPATTEDQDTDKRLALRRLLNDPDSATLGGDSSIPVVGPPVYGQWYLPEDAGWGLTDDGRPTPPDVPTAGRYFDAWVHELNVDPRWRIPAGYGTEVIQENQEDLMAAAWKQFGDLELANEQLGRSQLGEVVGANVTDRFERSGDHVVGVADRIRDLTDFHREIEAIGRLRDEGALVNHDPEISLEDEITGAAGPESRFDAAVRGDRLLRDGKLAVDGEKTMLSSEGTRKLNELRLGQGSGGLRGDGAGAAADPTGAARFKSLASPAFRRLTRATGKLDRGVDTDSESGTFTDRVGADFSFDTDRNLGGRFARVSDSLPADAPAGTTPASGGGDSETGASSSAPDQPAGRTDWRLDERGAVMSLSDAVDELDGREATVPKTLLVVESARDHCKTARERLTDLRDALADSDAEFTQEAVTAVTERPTVEDHCGAIKRNTFDTLDRQFGKLVAASPDAVPDDLTQDEVERRLRPVRGAHSRLQSAAEYVTDAIRSKSDGPQAVRGKVDEALAALDDLETALHDLTADIDSGVPPQQTRMQAMSAAFEMDRQGASKPLSLEGIDLGLDHSRATAAAFEAKRTELLQGSNLYPGSLDASNWAKRRAGWDIHPDILDREVELGRILAAPEFDRPMYKPLKDLDEQYLLPGVEKIPGDTIGALQTNSEFIESYMCGLNHEMARELQWRRYPTDRRGTYFRQFWKYVGQDQLDIQKLHEWQADPLGDNRAPGIADDRVVLIIRGDLLRAYPNTRIYAVKAVKEDKSGPDEEAAWDRVPLLESLRAKAIDEREREVPESQQTLGAYKQEDLEQDAWDPKEPIFSGQLDPDITFLGFDLETAEAEGETLSEDPSPEELGWFFVLEERVGETRFGFDVPTRGDYGTIPHGLDHGPAGSRETNTMSEDDYDEGAEAGWNALSWGHLVTDETSLDGKKYVRVDEDQPAGGDGAAPWAVTEGTEWNEKNSESWRADDAAEWGKNSAHMARATWQLPVRVCIHGDDILPELSDEPTQRYRLPLGGTEVFDG